MFRLKKWGDYITPRTTVTQVDLEGIICNSPVTFDTYVNEIVVGDDSGDDGENSNWDYLPS